MNLYKLSDVCILSKGKTITRATTNEGEVPVMKSVRFRTLGCYPLSGAVESTADNLADLISEMETSKVSERSGRLIDGEGGGSMEAKKAEGYF